MFWPCLYAYFLSNKIQELQNVCLSNFREQNSKENPKLDLWFELILTRPKESTCGRDANIRQMYLREAEPSIRVHMHILHMWMRRKTLISSSSCSNGHGLIWLKFRMNWWCSKSQALFNLSLSPAFYKAKHLGREWASRWVTYPGQSRT